LEDGLLPSPTQERSMTVFHRITFSLSAVILGLGLALGPVAYAQGMKDDGMKKPATDTMKKDAMDKGGAMSAPMKKDTMGKPDTMSKDTMSKPDTMSKDTMKK
jgi:pentapeptide MXKDX repeat protein